MPKTNLYNLSYWEQKTFMTGLDLVVVGAGIVGLNAAISFKSKNPKSRVLIIERGLIPSGASTKNAGFACFGSASELLADFSKMKDSIVIETVEMRIKGLNLLRKIVGDANMDFEVKGGFEVFDSKEKFDQVKYRINYLNDLLSTLTKTKSTFLLKNEKIKKFGLKGFCGLIESPKEGQLDPGKMILSLLEIASKKGILFWNERVTEYNQVFSGVKIKLSGGLELNTANMIVATNGFVRQLIPELEVVPARSQVLITSPVKGLRLNGVFHYDEGFYYFRNVGNRVLIGGGRNLDFQGEETSEFGNTELIQNKLESILMNNILSGKKYKIEHRWSGIMGLGNEKKPIIKRVSKNVVIGVRMGGMGVAIGSLVGKMAADQL